MKMAEGIVKNLQLKTTPAKKWTPTPYLRWVAYEGCCYTAHVSHGNGCGLLDVRLMGESLRLATACSSYVEERLSTCHVVSLRTFSFLLKLFIFTASFTFHSEKCFSHEPYILQEYWDIPSFGNHRGILFIKDGYLYGNLISAFHKLSLLIEVQWATESHRTDNLNRRKTCYTGTRIILTGAITPWYCSGFRQQENCKFDSEHHEVANSVLWGNNTRLSSHIFVALFWDGWGSSPSATPEIVAAHPRLSSP